MKAKNKTSVNWQDLLIRVLIGLLPAYGVWVMGWNIYTIIFLFAVETFVVGIFHFFKMKLCGENHGDHWFFVIHYGMFVFVQSILLTVFLWPGERWEGREFMFGSGYIVFLNGVEFIKNYFYQNRFQNLNASQIMMEPYGRIFTQQFFIILGAFFIFGLEYKNEHLIAALFVAFKLGFEMIWHFVRPSIGDK